MLTDIHNVFTNLDIDRISSQHLADSLAEDESSPWADWRGKTITPNAVAKLLAGFSIKPKGIRLSDGSTPRGYLKDVFGDAWSRYAPTVTATPTTTASSSQNQAISNCNGNGTVAVTEQTSNPHKQANVAAVAVANPETFPPPGQNGYLERLYQSFETNWLTEGEWHQSLKAHRLLGQQPAPAPST